MLSTKVFRVDSAGNGTKQLLEFIQQHAPDPDLMVVVVYRDDMSIPDKGFASPEQADVLRDQWH